VKKGEGFVTRPPELAWARSSSYFVSGGPDAGEISLLHTRNGYSNCDLSRPRAAASESFSDRLFVEHLE
jgi:hypothetical protein